jgi:SM-20-related protein
MSDVLVVANAVDAATCAAMVGELRVAESSAATTYGRQDRGREVNVSARRTTRVTPSIATRSAVERLLRDAMPSIATHFGIAVTELEEPQFLRYREGDFFVAHQDGNTPLLLADATNVRRISTVLFLSEPEAYEGGALVFHHTYEDREPVTPPAGTLLAFRAETTHEVTVLTRGERFTVVSWYR